MSLSDNIHQLCRDHLKTGPDGKVRPVPALLGELRLAVQPGNTGAAGGGNGKPSPINIDAVDMLHRITKQAETEYGEMTGKLWGIGTLEELLTVILSYIPNDEWNAYLETITAGWVTEITTFLYPEKPRRRLTGKECPACGLALHGEERAITLTLGCWDESGNMAPIAHWDIECGSCNAKWIGDEVSWLVKAMETSGATVVQLDTSRVG